MTEIKFTAQEQAEVETLTLTKKIARGMKGALTAKQLAELLNINRKTVFKMAKAGRGLPEMRSSHFHRSLSRLIPQLWSFPV